MPECATHHIPLRCPACMGHAGSQAPKRITPARLKANRKAAKRASAARRLYAKLRWAEIRRRERHLRAQANRQLERVRDPDERGRIRRALRDLIHELPRAVPPRKPRPGSQLGMDPRHPWPPRAEDLATRLERMREREREEWRRRKEKQRGLPPARVAQVRDPLAPPPPGPPPELVGPPERVTKV